MAREGIKNKILYESTHLDPDRKQTKGSGSHWAVSSRDPNATHWRQCEQSRGQLCETLYVPWEGFQSSK